MVAPHRPRSKTRPTGPHHIREPPSTDESAKDGGQQERDEIDHPLPSMHGRGQRDKVQWWLTTLARGLTILHADTSAAAISPRG
jgi:hypothetical protein